MNKTNLQRLKESLKRMLSKELSKPYVKKESAIGDPNLAQGGFNAGNGFSTNCWECDDVELKKMVSEIIKESLAEVSTNDPFDKLKYFIKRIDWYPQYNDARRESDMEREREDADRLSAELAKIDPKKVLDIWNNGVKVEKAGNQTWENPLMPKDLPRKNMAWLNGLVKKYDLQERIKSALKPLVLEAHRSIHAEPTGKYLHVGQFHEKKKDGTYLNVNNPTPSKLSDMTVDGLDVYFTNDPTPKDHGATWEILPDGTLKFTRSNWDSSD